MKRALLTVVVVVGLLALVAAVPAGARLALFAVCIAAGCTAEYARKARGRP